MYLWTEYTTYLVTGAIDLGQADGFPEGCFFIPSVRGVPPQGALCGKSKGTLLLAMGFFTLYLLAIAGELCYADLLNP
jgi:hypothetical protein